jgi:Ca-activated chloride channel homolog
MRFWLILVLAAALPWGLVAQDTSQQQLPTAPSAIKYPPPAATPPPAAEPTPAPPQTTAPSTSQPSAQSGNSSTASPQSNSQPSNGSAQSSQSDAATKPGASAAGSGSGVDDSIPLIRKRVDEVNVVFTVTDKRDHFVKDLTQSDFRVIDNNKPANIQSFSRQTNLPLRVGLLIDASNSVRDRFKFEQEAAIEFLNQIIRPRMTKRLSSGSTPRRRSRRISPTTRKRSPMECACCGPAAARPCTTPFTSPAATS